MAALDRSHKIFIRFYFHLSNVTILDGSRTFQHSIKEKEINRKGNITIERIKEFTNVWLTYSLVANFYDSSMNYKWHIIDTEC